MFIMNMHHVLNGNETKTTCYMKFNAWPGPHPEPYAVPYCTEPRRAHRALNANPFHACHLCSLLCRRWILSLQKHLDLFDTASNAPQMCAVTYGYLLRNSRWKRWRCSWWWWCGVPSVCALNKYKSQNALLLFITLQQAWSPITYSDILLAAQSKWVCSASLSTKRIGIGGECACSSHFLFSFVMDKIYRLFFFFLIYLYVSQLKQCKKKKLLLFYYCSSHMIQWHRLQFANCRCSGIIYLCNDNSNGQRRKQSDRFRFRWVRTHKTNNIRSKLNEICRFRLCWVTSKHRRLFSVCVYASNANKMFYRIGPKYARLHVACVSVRRWLPNHNPPHSAPEFSLQWNFFVLFIRFGYSHRIQPNSLHSNDENLLSTMPAVYTKNVILFAELRLLCAKHCDYGKQRQLKSEFSTEYWTRT